MNRDDDRWVSAVLLGGFGLLILLGVIFNNPDQDTYAKCIERGGQWVTMVEEGVSRWDPDYHYEECTK
jgi:hypothetical protein